MGFSAYSEFKGQIPAPRILMRKKGAARIPEMMEKEVTAQCDRLAAQLGWIVESYEQRRASHVTLGLPDRRYVRPVSEGVTLRLWCEMKSPAGKLTREQHAWLIRENEAGGLATVIDGVDVLARLFTLYRPHSGIPDGNVRRECAQLVHLCAQRGFRGEKKG